MTIKKIIGKTEEEAIEKAKQELGQDAVIMNVRTVKQKGFLGMFGKLSFEVTAAIEDEPEEPAIPKPAQNQPLVHEKINMAADEEIKIPPLEGSPQEQAELIANTMKKIQPILQEQQALNEKQALKEKQSQQALEPDTQEPAGNRISDIREKTGRSSKKEQILKEEEDRVKAVEDRIVSLQNMLDEKAAGEESSRKNSEISAQNKENLRIIKMIYNIMIENEVSEKYANQILDEIDSVMRSSTSMDYILSNVYQKMVLKFGQSASLNLEGKAPKVLFFIGPTGVGKTTTIAKIASWLKVEKNKKIAFFTADTYRIAASEQLKTYANILNVPMTIIYTKEDLNDAVAHSLNYDVILVDTTGFSHKVQKQKEDVKNLIQNLDPEYESEVYLLLSATTKYKDLLEIADAYKEISDYKLIFTKLDETICYGNLLNLKLYTGTEIAYTTNGQNVPGDIQSFNSQYIVKHLLGGK
ncbi:MAG: flagellar biosynthesis protein FlhF [Eubacterium sp.]|nr:flagellar biosynthesis protein FlhF [Eubacterium sp.]